MGDGRILYAPAREKRERKLKSQGAGGLTNDDVKLPRLAGVQAAMNTHPFKSLLALLVLVVPLAATAATPEEETSFVDAVKKAFDEKKPAELSKVTCWDGVSEQAKKKQEEVYKTLIEEKDVSFGVKLVEPDLKSLEKRQKKEGAALRHNLKIVKQLDLRLIDNRDHKTLGIIGFPVGEKAGKLLLTNQTPAK
jgi:hypothetical protein